MTDLFVYGPPVPAPPCCRRPARPLPPVRPAGNGLALVELPELAPRAPASRIIPSLCVVTDQDYAFRFEASLGGAWVALGTVGPYDFPDGDGRDERLAPDIDVFTVAPAVDRVRLRVRLWATDLDGLARRPTLVCVSLSDGDGRDVPPPSPPATPARGAPVDLAVPPLSQMETPAAIRGRICSPTCLAMVLAYWHRPVDPVVLAAETFDPRQDLYGIWPAAIRAAARRGVAGYLLRFPSWAAAAWCLDRRLPLIASVRYGAGELAGAAIPETRGHLLVVRGYEGDRVLVNDPAAPTASQVPRRYARADLERVWLDRTGVGYVLFEPGMEA